MARPQRDTADLSSYPDLVVIYLGMRAHTPRGVLTIFQFGWRIRRSTAVQPEGLLRHDFLLWGLFPLHFGMRQYWRDFDALEGWARREPHAGWWRALMNDTAGTGFWHETYLARGGMESVYLDMPPGGFSSFAPAVQARRSLFSARRRLRQDEYGDTAPAVSEEEFYG